MVCERSNRGDVGQKDIESRSSKMPWVEGLGLEY